MPAWLPKLLDPRIRSHERGDERTAIAAVASDEASSSPMETAYVGKLSTPRPGDGVVLTM